MPGSSAIASEGAAPLRIAELNSMLTGGGTDDRSVRIAKALQDLGQRVWMIGPGDQEYSRVARRLGLSLWALPARGVTRYLVPWRIALFVRRERIQIVQARHGRNYWMAVLAARLSGRRPRVVLCRHLAKSPGSWISRRFLLGGCDAFVAVSEFVARVLREGSYEPDSPEAERRCRPPMLGDRSKIRVVRNGVDTTYFRPSPEAPLRSAWRLGPEDYVFGMVGGYALPRGKGQREFLAAAARIHRDCPRARFVIVGRGNMKSVLEEEIDRLGLRGKAWLTPYCEDMPGAMNTLDCLVHPQVGTEALPGVVFEAHACGRPVIASAIDGVPEAFSVARLGALVKPESIEALAEAMRLWSERPRPTWDERARMHALMDREASMTASARNYLALYRSLRV